MIHVCMVTLGGRDLVELAIASLDKYAGDDVSLDIVDLPKDTTDPWAHGRAIDFWRQRQKIGIRDSDLVTLMDPDCVLLSHRWRIEVDRVFNDPHVGIWGAGASEDWGPRVHASMMVIRGKLFNNYEYSFMPQSLDSRWRDTGGNYSRLASGAWKVIPVERGPDWNGVSAWWGTPIDQHACSYNLQPIPLWSHLGGGSHSDPTRMTRWERVKRFRAIQQRERFKQAVRFHLKDGILGGRLHDERTAWDHT